MTRVFISYSTKDRGFVEQLARDLQANFVTPWFDRWEMLPGESLIQKIGSGILTNGYFVVVLSPNSVDSEWVQKELAVALNREFKQHNVQVIPALLKECSIPPFLQDNVYADFSTDYYYGLGILLQALGQLRESDRPKSEVPESSKIVWDYKKKSYERYRPQQRRGKDRDIALNVQSDRHECEPEIIEQRTQECPRPNGNTFTIYI